MFWENFWVLGHLLIVGFFIALIHLQENEMGGEKNPSRAHFWYVNILQFFLRRNFFPLIWFFLFPQRGYFLHLAFYCHPGRRFYHE